MKQLSGRFTILVQRISFTLLILASLMLVAWLTNSQIHNLARQWLNHLGFAPRDFWFLRWGRLVGSALAHLLPTKGKIDRNQGLSTETPKSEDCDRDSQRPVRLSKTGKGV